MANSQRGWDRLVNPVQDLGRTLLNFLVGGNSTSVPSQPNRENTSNLDSLNNQYPFPPTPKSDKSIKRQSDPSNSSRKQSTPIVLRRSQPSSQPTATSFSDDSLQPSVVTTPLGQSVPEKRDSDLVAFAVQDNSAAVHSPPVLVPPNVSRRKRKKDNAEVKAAIGKTNQPKPSGSQRNELKALSKNDQESEKPIAVPCDNNSISNKTEDASVGPRISFNNIVQRLSRSDLDDADIDFSAENKENLEGTTKDKKELSDTPKPSFRKIQERLKQTTDSNDIEQNKLNVEPAINSQTQNLIIEPVQLSDKDGSLPSLEAVPADGGDKIKSVCDKEGTDIFPGTSLQVNSDFMKQPIKLEPNNFKVSSLSYPFDHGESNQNRLKTEGEEKIFIQESLDSKAKDINVVPLSENIIELKTAKHEDNGATMNELSSQTNIENYISESSNYHCSTIESPNENLLSDTIENSSITKNVTLETSEILPKTEILPNDSELKDDYEKISDNISNKGDGTEKQNIQTINARTSCEREMDIDYQEEKEVIKSNYMNEKEVENVGNKLNETNKSDETTIPSKLEIPIEARIQEKDLSLSNDENGPKKNSSKLENHNGMEGQIDVSSNEGVTINEADSSTESKSTIPPPPPPPPPGFLMSTSNKQAESNETKGAHRKRVDSIDKVNMRS